MENLLKDIWFGLVDLLFPRLCSSCTNKLQASDRYICKSCYDKIGWIKEGICSGCGRELEGARFCLDCKNNNYQFDKARAITRYDTPMNTLIKKFKYNERAELCGFFADMISEHIKNCDLYKEIKFILAVPLHKSKYRDRGYNQSSLIAEKVADKCDLFILRDNLLRIKNTRSQIGLTYRQRVANMKNAFGVFNPHELEGISVILIDDVFTTGATTSECAKTLKESGCREVFVITVCQAQLDQST